MSSSAYQWVWKQNIKHAPSKLVLLTLADMANQKGFCWPSAKHIGLKTGLAKGTVRMCLRKLRSGGYIKSVSRTRSGNAGNTSNCYFLQLKRCCDEDSIPSLPVAPATKPLPKTILKRTLSGGVQPILDPAYSRPDRDEFFLSQVWKEVRYSILQRDKGTCQCCGRNRKDGVTIQVDHIIPVSVNWSKRIDHDNLQCLCSDCNTGKGNRSSDSWR